MMHPPDAIADGRYVIIDRLGQGGAAEVFRALDTTLDVERAVKIVKGTAATRGSTTRRQRVEAELLAQLRHPHILPLYDRGEHEGREWIVMELMTGGSLADHVRKRGLVSTRSAAVIGLELCSALAAAHTLGIVHRDVKPHNVLLDQRGHCVLADFGIALVVGAERHTRTGARMGSFSFMAPEQRVDAKHIGPTADLYAVGASLYWLLTGKTAVDLFMEERDSARMRAVPEQLRGVVFACTRLEPSDRPQTSAELAQLIIDAVPDILIPRKDLSPSLMPSPHDALYNTASTHDASRRSLLLPIALVVFVAALTLTTALVLRAYLQSDVDAPRGPTVLIEPTIPSDSVADLDTASERAEPGTDAVAQIDPVDVEELPETRPVVQSKPPPTAAFRGVWVGTFADRAATLQLTGPPERLQGDLTVEFMGSNVVNKLFGSWDAAKGTLNLVDAGDESDAGRYEATVSGGTLSGTFVARHRDAERTFHFTRENP